jgi:hypothetical protein
MKNLAMKIYDNTIVLYSLGLLIGLFFFFLSFKDISDFITRESVVSYSLFLVLATGTLLIQELIKIKDKKNQKRIVEKEIDLEPEPETELISFFSNETETDKVLYEWEEEEEKSIEEEVLVNKKPKIKIDND